MLSVVAALALTQCVVRSASWTPSAPEQVRAADGFAFARVEASCCVGARGPAATVWLESGRAELRFDGLRIGATLRDVKVRHRQPIAFDDGFETSASSDLQVVGTSAEWADVVPAERADLERLTPWGPRRVACADLSLPSERMLGSGMGRRLNAETPLKTTKNRPAITLSPGARVDVIRRSETRMQVSLVADDGARLVGWVPANAALDEHDSGEFSTSGTCCRAVRPPPTYCAETVRLFVRNGERRYEVGSLDKNTDFDAGAVVEGWAEIEPRIDRTAYLNKDWHYLIAAADLDACKTFSARKP